MALLQYLSTVVLFVTAGEVLPQWMIEIGISIEEAVAPIREMLVPFMSSPIVLAVWGIIVFASLGVLWWDLRKNNEALGSLMKAVWTGVVLYSGPFGVAVYWYSGRTQIPNDNVWRRGYRSTSHCYSGCGAGEALGVAIGTTLGMVTLDLVVVTYSLAYLFGFGLTVGPLMQEGVDFGEAAWDAFVSETPSITIMEVSAISTDLLLAGGAGMGNPLFWTALAFSLSFGYLMAWPVNAALILRGLKSGMDNPAEMN